MSSALPNRPRGFKVIIEGIPDNDPMASINIPTRWISQLLIDLELGKIQVQRGIVPYTRYSNGCPKKYFMSVVVTFESTINEELRTAIESGNNIQLTYANKGDTTTNKNGEQYVIQKDKYLTIKQYKSHTEINVQAFQDAKKICESANNQKQNQQKKKLSRKNAGNSFAALMCEK